MSQLPESRTIPVEPSRTRADAAVDLLLRPERYFETLLQEVNPAMPWLVIWICGMASVVDSLDNKLITGRMNTDASVLTHWPTLWGTVLLGGIISGLLVWLIGGWWYRMRMYLSGARDVNKRQARIVLMHSNLIIAVPSLAWLVLVTFLYADYHAAYTAGPLGFAFLLVLPWSTWVSYRAVRHCFQVRPGWARLWFLILPLSIYAVVIGVIWALTWFGLPDGFGP